jgi:hypothetical protein
MKRRGMPIVVVVGLSAVWTLLAGSTPMAAGVPGNVSVPIYLNRPTPHRNGPPTSFPG